MTNPWDRVFGVKWRGNGGAGADHAEEMMALEDAERDRAGAAARRRRKRSRRVWLFNRAEDMVYGALLLLMAPGLLLLAITDPLMVRLEKWKNKP